MKRRDFLEKSAIAASFLALAGEAQATDWLGKRQMPLSAHLWVYASAFPPDWNCTPSLPTIFADLKYAQINGLELMEVILRQTGAVDRLRELIQQHELPVTGTSYGAAMWDAAQHSKILDDVELVLDRLHQVGGKTFGISVGSANRPKTEAELDAQADLLLKVRKLCEKFEVVPNLHNHTYEVENGMHDLKGTLKRIPDFPLGPDLNWLVRGGVDPVAFIETYGKQMVYLHLRDQDANGVWTEALGEGVADFAAIGQALKQVGFKGRAAVELAFPKDFKPTRPLKETWKISAKVVRQYLG